MGCLSHMHLRDAVGRCLHVEPSSVTGRTELGMATGGQGDVFECARISLSVPAKGGGRKHLLTGVNFSASAGELVCCIGPSGAGKTMLLNALTFSVQGEMRKSNRPRVSGAITFAGRSIRNLKEFRRVCSFVPNHNLQFPTLTVKEILTFGAQMSSSDPPVVIKDRVNKIIKLLGLEGCQDTIAGGYVGLKGISGGQLKRLCIGQGLLTAPRVLFLDEPTRWVQQFYLLLYTTANLLRIVYTFSGLDSAAAAHIMVRPRFAASPSSPVV